MRRCLGQAHGISAAGYGRDHQHDGIVFEDGVRPRTSAHIEPIGVQIDVAADLAGLGAESTLEVRVGTGDEVEQVGDGWVIAVKLDGKTAASPSNVGEHGGKFERDAHGCRPGHPR